VRRPNCEGWLKCYVHPGGISFTYVGRSLSPVHQAVKSFLTLLSPVAEV